MTNMVPYPVGRTVSPLRGGEEDSVDRFRVGQEGSGLSVGVGVGERVSVRVGVRVGERVAVGTAERGGVWEWVCIRHAF